MAVHPAYYAAFYGHCGLHQDIRNPWRHSGTTIAVNLPQQIDYFGTTVNLAARIQGLAQAGELVLSDKVLNQAEDYLQPHTYTREQVNLKG
ncbi:MAG: hypothetical protein K9N34_10315, partial [Candidatus Marinimicrobia bacterium]|nr:hypothetical protein [Candidatus Neomarinimicrobiota bacterium]